MKKSHKKGFVLAEVIIVSVVTISALIAIYIQFISVSNSYYRSFKYNTVDDLYAMDNIRNFIENDNLDNITNLLDGSEYINLTNCSYEYFLEYNYCKNLLKTLNVKTLLLTYEDLTNLKSNLNSNTSLSEGLKTFIKTISSTKNNKYRLIAEFENDRYATLKIGSFIVSNISNDCVKEGNTCTINQIKNNVSLTLSVNDNESYRFNLLSDDGKILTLIMDDYLKDDIKWGSSITSGPQTSLDYLNLKTKNWDNVLDITYNLKGSSNVNFNTCSIYSECNSNIYEMSTINSKARLPRLQELTNLGCTDIAGSCPSWLSKGLNSSSITGFWTSSTNSTDAFIMSYDNRLKTNSINTNLKIKPVILIDKTKI